jgi:hypothetical protein
MRLLTAVFALLLACFGSVATPVSRIDAGRDSSAIVWIAEREAEQKAQARERPPAPGQVAAVEYRSRVVGRPPVFPLFQRPPPEGGLEPARDFSPAPGIVCGTRRG